MDDIKIYKDPKCFLESDCINFNEESYIISINGYNVGFFNLSFNLIDTINTAFIDYEVLKKYRSLGFGGYIYQIIEKYVIENFSINEIVLLIHYENIASTKIALKNEYKINDSYYETVQSEMKGYRPFSKKVKDKIKTY